MPRDNPPLDDTLYRLVPASLPPADYPTQAVPDTYCSKPFNARFNARRQAYLDYCLKNPSPTTLRAPFQELARLAAGGIPHTGFLHAALDYIDQRLDCADYPAHAILRLLYSFNKNSQLDTTMIERAREVLINFKYWPSEPGSDAMCTWTESHQILFAAADYLAGQMFPETRFTNAFQTGQQKMQTSRGRIMRWLDLRYRSGFGAWLSNVYYDEYLVALINLIDLCKDKEIVARARMVTDLLFYDLAINNFKGLVSCTQGIGYTESNIKPASAPIADTIKLMFGLGFFCSEENMSAVLLALSKNYQLPRVIYVVANDQDKEPLYTHQRMGIRVRETKRWHLDYQKIDDRMAFFGAEAYAHGRTIRFTIDTLNKYGLWEHPLLESFNRQRARIRTLARIGLLGFIANLYRMDITRSYLKEVNTITYRTPDYMLSSAQDYRNGYGGSRQHIWQATLGPQAVCFTTHPARSSGPSPNYWNGNGSLPRVAQIKNVLIAVYNIYDGPALAIKNRLLMTHAWFPQESFDQVAENAGWIFARYGDGYLALYSQHTYEWRKAPGDQLPQEIVVPGKQNIWVCEMGRKAEDGTFTDFIHRISQSTIVFNKNAVVYHSPTQGQIWFGWDGQLRRNGKPLPLDDYPRYDNACSQVAFDDDVLSIDHGKHNLTLTWSKRKRDTNQFI